MRPPVLAVLAFAAAAHAQLPPGDALKSFELADRALRVELVAAEPLVRSPCAMAFDERGRLFVAENRGYPNTANPPQGSIALLEDTDGDGRMDTRSVFADGQSDRERPPPPPSGPLFHNFRRFLHAPCGWRLPRRASKASGGKPLVSL